MPTVAEPKEVSNNIGAIVGGIVGGVIGSGVIGYLIYTFHAKKPSVTKVFTLSYIVIPTLFHLGIR